MKREEREVLKRLIEYAKLEAKDQQEDFAAYLLDLAARSLVPPEQQGGASPHLSMQ
jgi:hypothetical protein